MYVATCRHCGRTIVQHPSGTWLPRQGTTETDPTGIYCQTLPDRAPDMLHEPMPSGLDGSPEWLSPRTAPAPKAQVPKAQAPKAQQDSPRIGAPSMDQEAAGASEARAANPPRRGSAGRQRAHHDNRRR